MCVRVNNTAQLHLCIIVREGIFPNSCCFTLDKLLFLCSVCMHLLLLDLLTVVAEMTSTDYHSADLSNSAHLSFPKLWLTKSVLCFFHPPLVKGSCQGHLSAESP